jgi:hypothetical protein
MGHPHTLDYDDQQHFPFVYLRALYGYCLWGVVIAFGGRTCLPTQRLLQNFMGITDKVNLYLLPVKTAVRRAVEWNHSAPD